MRATGAEFVKLAVHAASLADCLRLLAVGGPRAARTILVAMGEAGIATRVLAGRFGSCWTYAGDSAPGQVGLSRLLGEFRFRAIGPSTAVYGVVGSPLAHSLSPGMHNACFAALGLDAVYLPLCAATVDDVCAFADAIGLRGASVTAPFKVDFAARVDRLEGVAHRLGCLNTIARRHGAWVGINTDVAGFLQPLLLAVGSNWNRISVALTGRRAAILGAGGAARAAAVALAGAGAEVSVFARNPSRAEAVAALVGGEAHEGLPAASSWDLLVNATPVGTFPRVDETPLPTRGLRGGLVYDLVYNPRDTRLLREAEAAGCKTIGGLEMLVAQAARQAAWWTGLAIPGDVMRRAAVEGLRCFEDSRATGNSAAPRAIGLPHQVRS
jgi:3-dehydroquinate dehydratase/shikimate dehydrogenase